MPRSKTKKDIEFGPLLAPLEKFSRKSKQTLADVVRSAVADKIGRVDLLDKVAGPGQPRKKEE